MALLQAGCQNDGGKNLPHSMANASPKSIERNRLEVFVHYVGQPKPFSFQVDDQNIGTDVRAVVGWLQGRGVTDVVIDSEYKLTSEGVRDLVMKFTQSGIVVKGFWIPRSTSPGRLNVLSEN
jgi:hypothetical protein